MDWSVKGRLETDLLSFSQGIDIENGVVWILSVWGAQSLKLSPEMG